MTYIILFLVTWWAFSVVLTFRSGIFVKRLQDEIPVLFMLPQWLSISLLIFIMAVIAPYVMTAPVKLARRWILLRLIAWRVRRMARGKDAGLSGELKSISKQITKL
jgi:predicted neutral ceramidase superfamily lipid hydrolase